RTGRTSRAGSGPLRSSEPSWNASRPAGRRASNADSYPGLVRCGRERLHDLAVHDDVRLALADPGDVVVARAAVERVDLAVGEERVEDVVAVPAVLGVDPSTDPEPVAQRSAGHGVVSNAPVQPVAPRAAADRVVAGTAPDDRAAVAGDDRVVVRSAEDPVEPEATVDAVVPAAGVDDVTAAAGADLVVTRERE